MGTWLPIFIIFASGLCSAAGADEYFRSTRVDKTVPAHCSEPALRQFSLKQKTVIYGIDGSSARGFTHEIAISRDDAAYLWATFLSNKQYDSRTMLEVRHRRLEAPFKALADAQREMGFSFEKEGDVLEALAITDLAREYPAPRYFITGGIEYSDGASNTIGELDILVGEREGCRIIAIGESKLGPKQLSHARKQLQRFLDFLRTKCAGSSQCG
ncbi:MAG: hypothetical protein A2070_09975 [Bdellovibrionales bacterium GWC1_52_8]|nr:MAG: hypothetical protein A2X97_16595 [Bdellovibrionales bacterium GWA1_52_35]OFZ36351.1 MAG: hypothetical protein A2070_09975 [Bdellovibrionales bacterium GWC1_52_8]HCM38994.1 hypothetical protein [Bdellovibrionales bacterium]